jgi:hypothetical protein
MSPQEATRADRASWAQYYRKRLESLQAVDEMVRDIGAPAFYTRFV